MSLEGGRESAPEYHHGKLFRGMSVRFRKSIHSFIPLRTLTTGSSAGLYLPTLRYLFPPFPKLSKLTTKHILYYTYLLNH